MQTAKTQKLKFDPESYKKSNHEKNEKFTVKSKKMKASLGAPLSVAAL